MSKLIDLSVSLQANILSDPPGHTPAIEYFNHQETAKDVIAFFPGMEQEDLIGQEGWAIERITATTHTGTHMDAPYHFASTMDGGARAITIDEVPLEWCFGRGVKLDFRHFEDGYIVTADDVESELNRIGHTLASGDIVVVNTSAGTRYGFDDYLSKGCGMGREATIYLTSRGIRVTGTDAWSWDAPFVHTAKKFAETGDGSLIWEGHKAGMEIGYCHIEKLHNLEALPSTGFQISCFPVKIHGASAGWTRAVAILDSVRNS